MADEENIIETIIRHNKENINVWKLLFICFVSIGLIIFLSISIYNSEWFINQTLQVKQSENIKLGKNTTWSYINKYENNKLKIQITIKNVDEKVMKIVQNYTNEDLSLLTLIFEDKDGYKITELEIPQSDFIRKDSAKGQYIIQTTLLIDKTNIRKIKKIVPAYKEALDIRYAELMKKVDNSYINTFNNFFGF